MDKSGFPAESHEIRGIHGAFGFVAAVKHMSGCMYQMTFQTQISNNHLVRKDDFKLHLNR